MRPLFLTALILPLAASVASPAAARGDQAPRGAKQCINAREIRDESAETHRRLIFHAGGDRAYRNYLPEPCPDLLHVDNIGQIKLHMAQPGKLCEGDTIELKVPDLLSSVTGSDADGTRCKLGRFEPITEMSLTEERRR